MPLVIVKRNNSKTVSDGALKNLVSALPKIIADNLTVPDDEGGRLLPEGVKVDVHEKHPMDEARKDLQITVFAHNFPSICANLRERQENMRQTIGLLIPHNADASLWVFLGPSAYGEIPRKVQS